LLVVYEDVGMASVGAEIKVQAKRLWPRCGAAFCVVGNGVVQRRPTIFGTLHFWYRDLVLRLMMRAAGYKASDKAQSMAW
jgi:hypothetical protein